MIELERLRPWLGREKVVEEKLHAMPANLMNAALDRAATFRDGDLLPAGWHWLCFHEAISAAKLGPEGHEQLGDFMPPIYFDSDLAPRRMWAGGTLHFDAPLYIGDRARKRSRIASIVPKEGRSGPLCFVTVEDEISASGRICVREERTIVYRPWGKADSAALHTKAAPAEAEFSATFQPDPILLFRYSALTWNAHRIHYDVDYCRQQEGYPDLVVHGPLTATLLMDLFGRHVPAKQIQQFTYRGISPLFNPNPVTLGGRNDGQLWAVDHLGRLTMSATAG